MFVHGAHGLQSSGWRHGQDPRFVDWGPRAGSGWSRSLRSIWSEHYANDSAGHGSFSQGVRGHHPFINPDCCELLLALRIRAHAKLFVGSCGCRTACFAFFEYKRDLPPCANAEAFALRRTVSQLRLDVQQGWSQKLVVAPLAATTRLRAVVFCPSACEKCSKAQNRSAITYSAVVAVCARGIAWAGSACVARCFFAAGIHFCTFVVHCHWCESQKHRVAMISSLTALLDVAKQRNITRFGMRCSEAGVRGVGIWGLQC